MQVDLNTTLRLAGLLDNKVDFVAESGIRTRADVEKLKSAGIGGVGWTDALRKRRYRGQVQGIIRLINQEVNLYELCYYYIVRTGCGDSQRAFRYRGRDFYYPCAGFSAGVFSANGTGNDAGDDGSADWPVGGVGVLQGGLRGYQGRGPDVHRVFHRRVLRRKFATALSGVTLSRILARRCW